MKLAVLGGSYNPIHIGHLMLADAVSLRYGYDTIAFVPAFLSPFKDGHSGCTAADRLAMVKLAIADNPAFYCEPCEIERQGVSYTIDTLKFLKEKYPQCEGKIGLIIGDDLLEGFSGWREAEHIPDYADIIVGNRIIDRYSTEQAASAGRVPHLRVDNALLPVSSSGIRAAIKEKKSWRYLVPSAVYSYIKEHKLYE
ncbi:nicotinate (nicotinamide) nucleotide adenylyltransferase [Treponema vincentii F0403]|uniref:Probable nicotinate-nucleotide adenylyltransferase n=1 Tax=Treponema vincentii F0403 TaxID=1125702 RepID=S3LRW2_9SPIR|nr:nicotinate (nicotinamide) nucleotide adenylyltransferase [Treponema vincentii]EPF47132.1 nicotinate (nicotinamide) nucleotide adenylyltransferase [Treponema vincentii F0403]